MIYIIYFRSRRSRACGNCGKVRPCDLLNSQFLLFISIMFYEKRICCRYNAQKIGLFSQSTKIFVIVVFKAFSNHSSKKTWNRMFINFGKLRHPMFVCSKKVEFSRFPPGLYKIFLYQQVYQINNLLWITVKKCSGKQSTAPF